jgi:D-alanyl-D-alanine carboxypeptidase
LRAKIVVAAEFTEPAKAAAKASGIIPIEVGEKVSLEKLIRLILS